MPLIPVQATVGSIVESLGGRAHPVAPGSEQTRPSEGSTVAEILGADGLCPELLLSRRRATRVFRPEGPAPHRVRKIVRAAYALDRRQWHGEGQTLSVLLGTSTLPDVAPGLYHCDPQDGAPAVPIGGPDPLPALRDLYADAPVLLFVCGDLRTATQTDRGIGYGSLLVRAGALGYSLWLAAVAEGLAGCVYGRPSAAVTAAAREVSPGMRHLFTVALGADGSELGREQVKHEG